MTKCSGSAAIFMFYLIIRHINNLKQEFTEVSEPIEKYFVESRWSAPLKAPADLQHHYSLANFRLTYLEISQTTHTIIHFQHR